MASRNRPVEALNLADEYLKFLQKNFNVKDSYKGIVKNVNELVKSQNFDSNIKEDINRLKTKINDIKLVDSNYNLFDKYAIALDKGGFAEVYRESEAIIKEINKARNWLKSYKKLLLRLEMFKKQNKVAEEIITHEELLALGQAILGRALELTPVDTGTLRKSAFILDGGDYILIGYSAPYAMYVHENLNIKHPHHKNNTDV